MLNRLSYHSHITGFCGLFLLTAAAVVSMLVPKVDSAGNGSSSELILQTPTDNVLRLSVTTNEIIYNPQDRMIYATRPSSVGGDGNSVTRINPLTGAVGASVYVGSEPKKLAISDDGQTIYVTLDGAFAIRRYDVATQTPGIQFSVGRGQSVNANDAPYIAGDIAVAPGNPNLLAVARDRPGISPPGAGVAVFNNGVRLPQTGPGHSESANYLAFSSSSATLYGGGYYQAGLRTLMVNESGVVDNTGSGTAFEVKKLKFENNLIFTSTGLIINPQTRTLLGTCSGVNTDAFVPDTATGRVFYAMKDSSSQSITIKAYDINTFTQVGSLTIPNTGIGEPTSLVRYGTNGLAMRTWDNRIYFIQTALIPTANPLPTPSGTPTPTPTPTPTVYTNFIRAVTLPNRDLIYSRAEQKFYASVPSSAAATRANSVTRINPATGALENSTVVGNQPGRLALSGDDQTLYVGIDGANAVRKFDTATQTPGLQFPLGTGVNGPKIAYDIDVLPGNSNVVAVSYGSTCYNYDGADIYDNGVKRAQKANASGQINIASPGTLYVGENYVYKYAISQNGLSPLENFSTGSAGESVLVGNLLYTSGGGVLDLTTKEYKGSFTGVGYWAGLTVDAPNNRVFFLVNESTGLPSWTLKAYRLDNFLPVGSLPLPGVSLSFPYCESPHRLIRWGENGLAFHDNNNKIYFVQSDLVSETGTIPSAVQFASQTYSGSESVGVLPVTVTRSGGLTGTTTVNYATQDGTAIAGADYTAAAGTLTFAPGEASKTINIPIINDAIYEGGETFNFVLSDAAGGGTAEVQSPSAAVLTIVDNDSQPGVSSPNISVNEPFGSGTSTALFTVNLSNPTTRTATVNYATVNGTATAGGDYVATSGTLVFAPLETTKTIHVQILADANFDEPNETFRINFSSAVNASVSISQVTATIINYNPQTARRARFDFDGDGKADVSVFRPDNGTWYLQQSTGGFAAQQFGFGTDKLVPADFDGDGKTDIAVFRNGTWYLNRSSLGFVGIAFGASDDVPVPADYDGDGKADVAVFRPSNGTWYVQQSTAGFAGIAFGQAGDKPTPADYDGDGKTDVAVFRSGVWYLNRSQLGFAGIAFGNPDDKLVPADYDGDGKTDVAVFRPSNGTWYVQQSQSGLTGIAFGLGTDQPAPADYDGDGKADVAVFRNGIWYLNRSTAGFTGVTFGAATDKPISSALVQ